MIKNKLIKTLVVLTIILFIGYFLSLAQHFIKRVKNQERNKEKVVLLVGGNKNNNDLMEKEIVSAFYRQSFVNDGSNLLKDGKIDKAIVQFEKALEVAELPGEKASIYVFLANAYEKKRNYEKALEYVIIDRDEYVNDWGKEPIVERAKYLEYAIDGEYELAIKHAELAIRAYVKIFNDERKPREDYVERLNDLKASKEYIESLREE